MSLYGVTFLDALGLAIIVPFIPFLLLNAGGDARLGGGIVALYALMTILSSPILGRLSDRLGRRTILIITVLGTAASYLLFAVAHGLALLLIARALAGFMAGNSGVVQAALTDLTTPEERGAAMGYATAANAGGFITGPAIGAGLSVVAGAHTQAFVGAVALVMSISAALMLWLWFAPVTTGDGRTVSAKGSVPPNGYQVHLLTLLGLMFVCQNGLMAITGFWAHDMFGWNATGVSILIFAVAGCILVLQLLVLPVLFRTLATPILLNLALFVAAVAALGCWVFGTRALIVSALVALLFCATAAAQTVLTTLFANSAHPERRGQIMGWSTMIGAVAGVLGPAASGQIYAMGGPQAPIFAVFAIALACLLFGLLRPLGRSGSAGPQAAESP